MRRNAATPERFWARVDRTGGPEACWPWSGGRNTSGYGQAWMWGRVFTAQRIAYQLELGEIPVGLQIDHLCRNRACVNPAHLEAVTPSENVRRIPQRAPAPCPCGAPRRRAGWKCDDCYRAYMRAYMRVWSAARRLNQKGF